jgi:hypothetical protein
MKNIKEKNILPKPELLLKINIKAPAACCLARIDSETDLITAPKFPLVVPIVEM